MTRPSAPPFRLFCRCGRCSKRHVAHLAWLHPLTCTYGREPYRSRSLACMARACMFGSD